MVRPWEQETALLSVHEWGHGWGHSTGLRLAQLCDQVATELELLLDQWLDCVLGHLLDLELARQMDSQSGRS